MVFSLRTLATRACKDDEVATLLPRRTASNFGWWVLEECARHYTSVRSPTPRSHTFCVQPLLFQPKMTTSIAQTSLTQPFLRMVRGPPAALRPWHALTRPIDSPSQSKSRLLNRIPRLSLHGSCHPRLKEVSTSSLFTCDLLAQPTLDAAHL